MNKEIEKFLNDERFTLIGSRGLGYEGEDYDFIILQSDLDDFGWLNAQCLDIRSYVNVMPMGNGMLLKGDGYDVLVYGDQRDITALTRALNVMKNEIKYNDKKLDYGYKSVRVDVFETLYRLFQKDNPLIEDCNTEALQIRRRNDEG
jgi:hypothetical protein